MLLPKNRQRTLNNPVITKRDCLQQAVLFLHNFFRRNYF